MRYIPAETKVAEWINADAGIGASIESGNQKWNGNCADLQHTHIASAAVAITVLGLNSKTVDMSVPAE